MKHQKSATSRSYRRYPSDEEWALVAPYLTLMTEGAPQREYPLRSVFNAFRWIVRAGAPWRMMPNDLPPWQAVYQQTQRWLASGVFEQIVNDLRAVLRFVDLTRDYERLPQTLAGMNVLAFAIIMLRRLVDIIN